MNSSSPGFGAALYFPFLGQLRLRWLTQDIPFLP